MFNVHENSTTKKESIMRSIVIAGNVGKDSEIRQINDSTTVLSFSVAVSRFKKDDPPIWFDCSLFGERAKKLAQYITKGTKVCVSGDLDTHEHNGKTYLKVRCNEVTLMGGKPANGNAQALSGGASTNDDVGF
jgi:single-strand DNA-binding protein